VTCPAQGNLNSPTYRLLQSLPLNPHTLLALINAKTQGEGQSSASEAFATIGDLLRESIAPPRLSAALYRAAALIPGVTVVHSAVDTTGRHGVAIAFSYRGDTSEWIFNKRTLQLIGERDLSNGSVTYTAAIMARAFVNRAGQEPSS
jgi:hypothetical protein